MALSRHTKYIINLYILSIGLIIVGTGIIAVGSVVSYNLYQKVLRMGRELSVLEIEDRNDWGDIPGTRQRHLRHQFFIFNISNPREAIYGQKPVSRLLGPFTFDEERDSEHIVVSEQVDHFGYKGELFTYDDTISLEYTPSKRSPDLNDTFYVYNYETFTMQYSHRAEEDWMRASKALATMINYTATQFRDQLILHQFRQDYFETIYGSQRKFTEQRLNVFVGFNEISKSTIDSFWTDRVFGFRTFNNVLYWGAICQDRVGFDEQYVHDYFFIPRDALSKFLDKFCLDWNTAAERVDDALSVENDGSKEAIFYRQWSNSNGSRRIMNRITMKDVDPLITGQPEMYVFFTYTFLNDERIARQYTNIDFYGIPSLESRIMSIFKQDDMRVSLFNATNMKTLFELGRTVKRDLTTGFYTTTNMNPLSQEMGIGEEELYAIYAYFVHLIDHTFLRVNDERNGFDKISMSISLSHVLREEFRHFRAAFTSKLVAAVAYKFLGQDSWEEGSRRLFPNTPTNVACRDADIRLNTTHGGEFWFRLFIGRSEEDQAILKSKTGYELSYFDQYFLNDKSDFTFFTNSIFDGIGAGRLEQIWRNNDNIWWSIQELAYHQMMSGVITENPPPILSDFTPASTYVDFFNLGNDESLISPEFNFLGRYQIFVLVPGEDVGYFEIILGMRDNKLYNPFYILNILNGKCDIPQYCSENFKTWLTFIYRNRGLPPLVTKRTVREILNGTESEYLQNVQRTNTQLGGDPTVRTSFNVLPYGGNERSKIVWEVFSGDRNPDRARNIFRYNQTAEFITVERPFYHRDKNPALTGVRIERKNPWNVPVFTCVATESSQFMPDMNNQDDLLYYSVYFKALIRIDYKQVQGIYGIKGFVYETPVNLYELRENQRINGITDNNINPYHNYVYDDIFNVSSVFGISYFVTEPLFSRTQGITDRLDSEIVDGRGNSIVGDEYYNDFIITEPYSGLVIRGDEGFQMNFLYDSWSSTNYRQFLMPYILYSRRQDIDGGQARDLFNDITVLDERMKLILIITIIMGGILFSAGSSLFILTWFRNRQRLKLLKELKEEEERRIKAKKLKKKLIKKEQRKKRRQEERETETNNALNDTE